jgi:hypothetical protein
MRRAVYLAVLCLWAVPAFAQTPDVNNPSGVTFTASPDHATIDSYEMDILRPDATVLQTLNLGKPTPDATQTCAAPINVQPVAFGAGYSMQLRARAGTAVSVNIPSLNKFNRLPGAPSKFIIGKEPEPEANY